jgi:hypothetical protein
MISFFYADASINARYFRSFLLWLFLEKEAHSSWAAPSGLEPGISRPIR